MISERSAFMFAAVLASVISISFSVPPNDFELPFKHESKNSYISRTAHMSHDRKLSDDGFDRVKQHYKSLINQISHYKIMDTIYPVLPDSDDVEGDFMRRVLTLKNCNAAVQSDVIRHMEHRMNELESSYPAIKSDNYDHTMVLTVREELEFLSECVSAANPEGRLKDIFMNTFYGNRYPAVSGKQYFRKPSDFTRQGGRLVFGRRGGKNSQRGDYEDDDDNDNDDDDNHCHNCSVQGGLSGFLNGIKHSFQSELDSNSGESHEVDDHQSQGYHLSEYSDWFSDLRKTDPLFGESYMSYVLRVLRAKRMPLPQKYLDDIYGNEYALTNQFHIWPELDAAFVMFYLFNCNSGDKSHNSYVDDN